MATGRCARLWPCIRANLVRILKTVFWERQKKEKENVAKKRRHSCHTFGSVFALVHDRVMLVVIVVVIVVVFSSSSSFEIGFSSCSRRGDFWKEGRRVPKLNYFVPVFSRLMLRRCDTVLFVSRALYLRAGMDESVDFWPVVGHRCLIVIEHRSKRYVVDWWWIEWNVLRVYLCMCIYIYICRKIFLESHFREQHFDWKNLKLRKILKRVSNRCEKKKMKINSVSHTRSNQMARKEIENWIPQYINANFNNIHLYTWKSQWKLCHDVLLCSPSTTAETKLPLENSFLLSFLVERLPPFVHANSHVNDALYTHTSA